MLILTSRGSNDNMIRPINCRNPFWRQPTPLAQYQALLMSIDGNTAIFAENIITKEKYLERMTDGINQLRELLPHLENGQWLA